MLTEPNAGCGVETFAMIVDVTRKDHVNVTVVYKVLTTLLG